GLLPPRRKPRGSPEAEAPGLAHRHGRAEPDRRAAAARRLLLQARRRSNRGQAGPVHRRLTPTQSCTSGVVVVPVPLDLAGFVGCFVVPVPVFVTPPPCRTGCRAATSSSAIVCGSRRVTVRDVKAPVAAETSSSRRAGRTAARIVTPPSVRVA